MIFIKKINRQGRSAGRPTTSESVLISADKDKVSSFSVLSGSLLVTPLSTETPKGEVQEEMEAWGGGMCSVAPTHLQPVSFLCCLSLPPLTPAKHILGTTLQFHTHPSAGMSSSPSPVQYILSGKTFDVPQGQDDSLGLWALPPTLVILCRFTDSSTVFMAGTSLHLFLPTVFSVVPG